MINHVCLLCARCYSETNVVGNLSFRVLKASIKLSHVSSIFSQSGQDISQRGHAFSLLTQ